MFRRHGLIRNWRVVCCIGCLAGAALSVHAFLNAGVRRAPVWVEEPERHFGTRLQHDVIQSSFVIHNDLDESAEITRINNSCDSTKADARRLSVQSRGETAVDLEWALNQQAGETES